MIKVSGHSGIYSISPSGEVRNALTGRTLKPWVNKHTGYYQVTLGTPKTRYTVHSLVANAYCSNPDNLPCINHIDGDKLNVAKDNLEWCTYSHNSKHAHDTGLNKGSRVVVDANVKLMLESGMTGSDIAEHLNVSPSCVTEAKRRMGMSIAKFIKLTVDEKSEAVAAVLAGVPQKSIANVYGCDPSIISRLVTSCRQADGVL